MIIKNKYSLFKKNYYLQLEKLIVKRNFIYA